MIKISAVQSFRFAGSRKPDYFSGLPQTRILKEIQQIRALKKPFPMDASRLVDIFYRADGDCERVAAAIALKEMATLKEVPQAEASLKRIQTHVLGSILRLSASPWGREEKHWKRFLADAERLRQTLPTTSSRVGFDSSITGELYYLDRV